MDTIFKCCCGEGKPPASGQVVVAPLNGKELRNTDSFGKGDPYVVVSIGTQSGQTEVANNMGSTPTWSTKLTFTLDGSAETIKFVIYDKDTMNKNDLVGQAEFRLAKLSSGSQFKGEIPVKFEDRDAGLMTVDIQHIP